MSSPITFSGFNSIDFNQILNLVMQQESQPLTALQTQQSTLNSQNSLFSTLAGKLSTLGSAANNLKDLKSMSLLSATSSDAGVGVSTTSGTTPGTYDIVVSALAKAQTTASTAAYGSTSDAVGTGGTFTIEGANGSTATITLTGSTTLQELADKINADANSPATAAIVQSSPNHYQLVLTGDQTGIANAFTITSALTGGTNPVFTDTDNDGKAGNTLADNTQGALDASFTVNGLQVTSSSNSVTDAVPGVTLSLNKKDPATTVTVTVSRDMSGAESLVNKFISAYNDIVKFTKDQATSAQNGFTSISRDPLLRGFKETMRTALMTSYVGGSFEQLAGIGIGFDMNGNMTLDKPTFEKALSTSSTDVQQLFSGTDGTGGAFGNISTIINSYTQAGGMLSSVQDRITSEVSSLGKRIDAMSAMLDVRRAALQQEYTAADLAMTQLKTQSAQISSVGSSISSSF